MRWPPILRSTGRTNCSKVTIADTGFPGRPKTSGTGLPGNRPNAIGNPGFMRTPQKLQFASQVRQNTAHVIPISHRNARRTHDAIGSQSRPQVGLDVFRTIACNTEVDEAPPRLRRTAPLERRNSTRRCALRQGHRRAPPVRLLPKESRPSVAGEPPPSTAPGKR